MNVFKEINGLLTAKEASQLLKIQEEEVYKFILDNELEIMKIGLKEIRIPKRTLVNWIFENDILI